MSVLKVLNRDKGCYPITNQDSRYLLGLVVNSVFKKNSREFFRDAKEMKFSSCEAGSVNSNQVRRGDEVDVFVEDIIKYVSVRMRYFEIKELLDDPDFEESDLYGCVANLLCAVESLEDFTKNMNFLFEDDLVISNTTVIHSVKLVLLVSLYVKEAKAELESCNEIDLRGKKALQVLIDSSNKAINCLSDLLEKASDNLKIKTLSQLIANRIDEYADLDNEDRADLVVTMHRSLIMWLMVNSLPFIVGGKDLEQDWKLTLKNLLIKDLRDIRNIVSRKAAADLSKQISEDFVEKVLPKALGGENVFGSSFDEFKPLIVNLLIG